MRSQLLSTLGLFLIASPSSYALVQPKVGATWHVQYSPSLTDQELNKPVDVYNIDLFDTATEQITTLHSNGKTVICYFSAGSLENWRPDVANFSGAVTGQPLEGWAGETWVDTRDPIVRKAMQWRIEYALSKGCDGVDPDNVDGYDNSPTGFPLTPDTATDYVTYLANEAHSLGLAIGLKNSEQIISSLLPIMQWAVQEQCIEQQDCTGWQQFISAQKPVFNIEYPSGAPDKVSASNKKKYCTEKTASAFSTVLKDMDLSEDAYDCWNYPN